MRSTVKNIYYLMLLSLASLGFLAACSHTTPVLTDAGSLPAARVQTNFSLPPHGDDIVGQLTEVTIQPGDTLSSLAQRYQIGYKNLRDANPGVRPNALRVGERLVLPTAYILPPSPYRQAIVINIPALQLYYFSGNSVQIYPVALGREGWGTPIARTYVFRKQADPVWHVPASIRQHHLEKTGEEHARQIEAGPDNPLGPYAIYLHMDGYLIHGTNAPSSIGQFVSSGCIRMYNANVTQLFHQVQRGTRVNIIYYPAVAGWQGSQLYLTAYRQVTQEHQHYAVPEISARQAIADAIVGRPAHIDWGRVQQVLREGRGIPVAIGVAG